MKNTVFLLRLSYWTAAVADFLVAWLVWQPVRMGVETVVYPMGLASAAIFSWGVMLLIADRKPMERRWVLLPTILVVALLSLTRVVYSWRGLLAFSWPLLLLGLGLLALLGYSYYRSAPARS